LRPHAASCFISTNFTNGLQPNADNSAGASGAGSGPGGPPAGGGTGTAASIGIHTFAITGTTSFVPAVAYRQFALPAYFSESPAPTPTPAVCNSSINPTVFQVFHLDGIVQRASLCNDSIVASIPVPSNPLQVQVTPDGRWAIVTSYDQGISFIDTNTNTVAKIIQTDNATFPSGIAISPDGSYALVTSYIDVNPALLVVDIQSQTIIDRIPLDDQYPQSVFLNPDGTLAWVTYPFDNRVEVIDVMTGVVSAALLAEQPIDVVFNPTGTVAYISNASSGSVRVVNTGNYSLIKEIPTGAGASDLLLTEAGDFLVVNNFGSNSLSVIDTAALKVVSTTPTSGQPVSLVLSPVR
jgi:YVTN family beta-propeller protein